MIKKHILSVFLLGIFSCMAFAAAPRTLEYKGRLATTTGAPVTTVVDIKFMLFNDATGGYPLWNETHKLTPEANGIFSVILGKTSPIYVDMNQQLWLAIECPPGPATALWPRRQLAASPYAFYSNNSTSSESVAGGTVQSPNKISAKGASRQIVSKNWDYSLVVTGWPTESASATWESLRPEDMSLVITTDASMLYIDSYISRVQHTTVSTSTIYRIVVDGKEISEISTGKHDGWNFHSIALDGYTTVEAGTHNVRLQFYTTAGKEHWANDTNGKQIRRLTAMEFKI